VQLSGRNLLMDNDGNAQYQEEERSLHSDFF